MINDYGGHVYNRECRSDDKVVLIFKHKSTFAVT